MASYKLEFFVFWALCAVALAQRGLRMIDVEDKTYAGMCPTDQKNARIATKDRCDTSRFIMCYKGVAKVSVRCPEHSPRFNPNTGNCDYERNVPLPEGCRIEKTTAPTTCADGVLYIADTTSCKRYIACVGGMEQKLDCPALSYFIDGRCRYDTPFYRDAINQEALAKCRQLDQWKKPQDNKFRPSS